MRKRLEQRKPTTGPGGPQNLNVVTTGWAVALGIDDCTKACSAGAAPSTLRGSSPKSSKISRATAGCGWAGGRVRDQHDRHNEHEQQRR